MGLLNLTGNVIVNSEIGNSANNIRDIQMNTHYVGSASARIVADSSIARVRLTSLEVEFPRPFLAEFNTHRMLSKNSASSRAIPVWKRLLAVLEKPYVPNTFGANMAGMQAADELSEADQTFARTNWLIGRDLAVMQAFMLAGGEKQLMQDSKGAAAALCQTIRELQLTYGNFGFNALSEGLHKQHVNRILEPYGFHTVIVTGTHWRNFLALRCSRNAQPEAQDFGLAIAKAMQASASKELDTEGWHLPYVQEEDLREITDPETLAKISAGRCARVSYLTQDGRRSLDADITMCRRLLEGGHMSPFEHQARPRRFNEPSGVSGNLHPPWAQHRKLLPSENDFSRLISSSELTEGCRGDNSLAKFILSLTS